MASEYQGNSPRVMGVLIDVRDLPDGHGFTLDGVRTAIVNPTPTPNQWRLGQDPDIRFRDALVLAWDFVVDKAGIDRAYALCCPNGEKTIGLVIGDPPLREAIHRARYAEWRGLGRAVFVDADGNELPK